MKAIWKSVLPIAVIASVCIVLYAGCSKDKDNGTDIPTITVGQLDVKSTPSGAKIYLDSVDKNELTPFLFNTIDTGSYLVELVLEGYQRWQGTYQVKQAQKTTVNATLDQIVSGKGTLVVNSIPTGASVFLDGVDKQVVTNTTLNDVDSGSHSISLKKSGYVDWDSTVGVVENQTTTVNATLSVATVDTTYVLELSTIGNGQVTADPDKDEYDHQDTVVLMPAPASGWFFDKWIGDLTGEKNPDTLVMLEDNLIQAVFGHPDSARIAGTISFPGGSLVRPIALVDTSHSDSIVVLQSIGFLAFAETGYFEAQYTFSGVDTIMGIITGWDDVSGDETWDDDEPRGWWDVNSDGNWNSEDMVPLVLGETITGAEITLYDLGKSPIIGKRIDKVRIDCKKPQYINR